MQFKRDILLAGGFFLAWITLAGILIFRLVGPLQYNPVAVEGLAPTTKPINLNDSRKLQQTFRADFPQMSHVGVHVMHDSIDDEAVLSVDILDSQGQTVSSAHTLVKDLRADWVTMLPVPLRLTPGDLYTLQLRVKGIPVGTHVSVPYEGDARGFPDGQATLLVQNPDGTAESRELTGNIRFQIVRFPTKWLVTDTLLRSAGGWIIALTGGVIVLLFAFRRRLTQLFVHLAPPLPLKTILLSPKELILAAAVGAALAFFVTAPYYTQLDKITTMGDVQRALVYRAVARTALLSEGAAGLWDPYLCGGEPLLANMESAQWDPFFLLVLIFGENLGTRLSVTATLIIGFVGAYALARGYGRVDRLPALLAAGLFSFSGFQMLAFANGNFAWIPVGFIPWVIYFFLKGVEKKPQYILFAALNLAFIFLGGSLHMTLYALIAGGLLALFLALLYRSWRPMVVLGLIAMLFLPLTAVKLLPAAEVQAISGEFDRPLPFIQPWEWIGKMFWERDQLDTPQWRYEETGENFRWIEYGAYVGIVPVVLFLIGAILSYKHRWLLAVVGACIILLLMTFGEFPWTLLHNLPFLYGPLRNPQRARVVLLLFMGLIAGYGLTVIGRKLLPSQRVRTAVMAAVVALVLLDLATFHANLYPKLFNLDQPQLNPSDTFVRLPESHTDEERGYYKVSYENYKAGQGVVDICMPYMMQRGVAARGIDNSNPATPYFGEAMLTGGGEVTSFDVQPESIQLKIEPEQPGWLVLNQNFFPGWRTDPPREITNWDGLVAARITPEDREIIFRYRPASYVMGLEITLAASALFLVFLTLSNRPQYQPR